MLGINNNPFINLDSYLDISKLLDAENELYKLYSDNQQLSNSTWTSGSIPMDTNWSYLTDHRTLYYHKHKMDYDYSNDDPSKLATYLKLKYDSFDPYRILHLKDNNGYREFIPNNIKELFDSLPFETIDTVSLFYNEKYMPQGYHRDYNYWPIEQGDSPVPPSNDKNLIWFRFKKARAFYVYDIDDDGKVVSTYPVQGHAVYFNHYDWHGNINPSTHTSLTIKIEGKFKKELHDKIYS